LKRASASRPRRWRPAVHFQSDGAIVYDRVECDCELPRDINGYQRDPLDPFRFAPLWPACSLRGGIALRLVLCGCIEIIMRCQNPKSPHFVDRVKWEQCRDCAVQVRPGSAAIFVDADKSGVDLFFEPDSNRPPSQAEKKSSG
jgi:hypothetical protein